MIFEDYKGDSVRLEDERWKHININHPETRGQIELIKETIKTPDYVQEGDKKEILAIKRFWKTPVTYNKYCVVIYRKTESNGFIITSYFARRPSFKRKLLWKKR
jgi:hypothetical protein